MKFEIQPDMIITISVEEKRCGFVKYRLERLLLKSTKFVSVNTQAAINWGNYVLNVAYG